LLVLTYLLTLVHRKHNFPYTKTLAFMRNQKLEITYKHKKNKN
jgi:hypothetical protein